MYLRGVLCSCGDLHSKSTYCGLLVPFCSHILAMGNRCCKAGHGGGGLSWCKS